MVRYRVSPTVLVQKVLTETVLLHTRRGEYFELNEMGSEMLRLLRDSGDPESVVSAILADYDVDEGELRRDFASLLAELEREGLVVRGGESHGAA